MVTWPGVIPSGQESDALMAAIDLLPTLCHACGIDWKKKSTGKPKIDGVNMWNTLLGKEEKNPRSELLYWHGMSSKPQAIRAGNWKLFFNRQNALNGMGTARKTPEQAAALEKLKKSGNDPVLFNLKDDIGETVDLSEKHPDKVRELKARAEEIMADIKSSTILPVVKPKK